MDGAYDGMPTNEFLNSYFEGVDIIIPPPKGAILGTDDSRNLHIKSIVENGRMNWQKESGYNRRPIVETQIGRYKKIIGAALESTKIISQKIESKISVKVLDQMPPPLDRHVMNAQHKSMGKGRFYPKSYPCNIAYA